jgi:hypothetical protein
MYGTYISASATACAKLVIDGCKVVHNGNSAVRTSLLALHTADTAVRACLTCRSALIVVGACYYNAGCLVKKMDDGVRTLANANSASDTLACIYPCYTVLNGDSILRTNGNAVAVAKAGIST